MNISGILMRAVLLTIGALTVAQGQDNPLPIVFDDWWNVDFVKTGCEMVPSHPCFREPESVVREFENELQVAFATEPACHGLSLSHFTPEAANFAAKNPRAPATDANGTKKMALPHWQLMFDLDGHSSKQSGRDYSLVDSRDPWKSVYIGHITTPERTMQQVCKIVRGVGGKTE